MKPIIINRIPAAIKKPADIRATFRLVKVLYVNIKPITVIIIPKILSAKARLRGVSRLKIIPQAC
jgi:hypothetical protein